MWQWSLKLTFFFFSVAKWWGALQNTHYFFTVSQNTHIFYLSLPYSLYQTAKFWTAPNWKHLQNDKGYLTLSQMTNFRLFQRLCTQQFQIWWKSQKVQTIRKDCGKRRNCSLWAIYPFPSVFKGLLQQTCKNQGLLGKGLNEDFSLG